MSIKRRCCLPLADVSDHVTVVPCHPLRSLFRPLRRPLLISLINNAVIYNDFVQITHVFSDKTGTLTQNVMDFRKCTIGGKSYGKGMTEIGQAALKVGQRTTVDTVHLLQWGKRYPE